MAYEQSEAYRYHPEWSRSGKTPTPDQNAICANHDDNVYLLQAVRCLPEATEVQEHREIRLNSLQKLTPIPDVLVQRTWKLKAYITLENPDVYKSASKRLVALTKALFRWDAQ